MPAVSHIFLTGFMGSGKTVLGKKLAALFNMPFADLDAYIEQQQNQSIAKIFETHGEAAFRKMEAQYLHELLQSAPPMVVSLGGGTVCFENNMQTIKQHGLLVYIQLSATALASRLNKSKGRRPLLKGFNGASLVDRIAGLLTQREQFYNQAHLIISGINLTPQLLHQHILEFKQAHSVS